MNILIIPSWYETEKRPTLGSFFREQAIALRKKGHKVAIIYPGLVGTYELKETNFTIKEHNDSGVQVFRINTPGFGLNKIPRLAQVLFSKKLHYIYKYVEQRWGNIDIIHAHSCVWAGYSSVTVLKKYNKPIIITEHSTAFPKGSLSSYEKKCVRDCIEKSDGLICVSNDLKKYLNEFNKVGKKINVIPNMVSESFFENNNYKVTCQNKDTFSFKFLSIAYLTHKKGLDILIKAFANMCNEFDDITLDIGGHGEEYKTLLDLTKRLEITDKVNFLGSLSRVEVNNYISKCNVFVLPSRFETFGVVFIEALAKGKPIIASRCGGPEDIVNEQNGLLVKVDDIEDLERAMKKIYLNYKTYNSKMIIDNCKSTFSEEVVINRLENYYKEIMN